MEIGHRAIKLRADVRLNRVDPPGFLRRLGQPYALSLRPPPASTLEKAVRYLGIEVAERTHSAHLHRAAEVAFACEGSTKGAGRI